jgi:outer membrane protein TolC
MRKLLLGLLAFVFLLLTGVSGFAADAGVSPAVAIGGGGAEQTAVTAEAIPEGEAIPYLTYEEAVELALKNSLELKNARQNVVQAEEMRDHLSRMRTFGYTPVGNGYDYDDATERLKLLNFVQADIAWQMARKQVGILEEAIALQVRSAYDAVLKKLDEIEVSDLTLAYAAEKVRQAEIKAERGMESLFNLQMLREDYNEEKQKRDVLEKQLEEAFLGLNELLGLEKEERPNLKGEFLPDWLEDVNLERHLTRVLNGNPLLWLQEQKIRMAEYGLALYTYNVGAEPYKVKEIDVLKEKNNLAAMKEDLETTILSLYNQLQQLENQYALLEVNLAKAQKALDAVTARYAQGMAVAIDVQQAELAIAQLENQLQNILITYEQLKILFEKPWLKSASL